MAGSFGGYAGRGRYCGPTQPMPGCTPTAPWRPAVPGRNPAAPCPPVPGCTLAAPCPPMYNCTPTPWPPVPGCTPTTPWPPVPAPCPSVPTHNQDINQTQVVHQDFTIQSGTYKGHGTGAKTNGSFRGAGNNA